MPKKATTAPDFEAALAELEKLVETMESGEQSLEETLAAFQKGIELTRSCQEGLKAAEQKVEQLVQKNGKYLTEPVEPEDE
ncbi:MAG: exodeoxyribonuclease VII small subunit [Acidiferrobacterales bacterium]